MKPPQQRRTVVIYSGGLDSTVLLYKALEERQAVMALSVNYGQRHGKELQHAIRICSRLRILHSIVNCDIGYQLASSSQTNRHLEVPEGHYADESMKVTVVPNRNMIMISLAAAIAIDRGFHEVTYGAHGGDHAIYPDCREVFVLDMAEVLEVANYEPISIWAPFLRYSKADLVKMGHELNVPFNQTWSCYKGGDVHCGKCGTCVERIEAFKLAGIADPTTYAEVVSA